MCTFHKVVNTNIRPFLLKKCYIWIVCALPFSWEASDIFLCSLTLLEKVTICKSTYYFSIFFFLENISS